MPSAHESYVITADNPRPAKSVWASVPSPKMEVSGVQVVSQFLWQPVVSNCLL